MTNENVREIKVVIYDEADGKQPHVETIEHGENMIGTNPVAVLHGPLCARTDGCQWCTALRDRIRSRTLR